MDLKCKKTKGITLIALVITIIILLILAGITIGTLLGENGIITRATKAREEYKIAEAREKLSLVLVDAGIEKRTNIKYNQDAFLDQYIKDNLEGSKIRGDIVIVDGYAFNLDRSVPKIGEYLGKEEELVFPDLKVETHITANHDLATIKITAQESKNGISKIEVILDGDVVHTYDNYNNTKDKITENYTTDKNGIYVIKAYSKFETTCITEVKGVISPIVYEPNGSNQYARGFQVKVSVSESNEKVKSIKYQWTNSTVEPRKETFTQTVSNGGTISKNGLTGKYYLWTLLETESGATRTGKSEAFYFDNKGPTVTLTSTPVSETSFTLKAEATDADVKKMGTYIFYANGKEVERRNATGNSISITVKKMATGNTDCYVKVTDQLGNLTTSNTITATTKLYTWERWSTILVSTTYPLTRIATREVHKNNYNGPEKINVIQAQYEGHTYNETKGRFETNKGLDVDGSSHSIFAQHGMIYSLRPGSYEPTEFGYTKWATNYGWEGGSVTNNSYWVVYDYKKETKENYKKGERQYTDVTSTNSSTYPRDGKDGSYWYKYKGIQ